MRDELQMRVISGSQRGGSARLPACLKRPLINIGTAYACMSCYRTSGERFLAKETGFQGIAPAEKTSLSVMA
jgi:hypothetical protein